MNEYRRYAIAVLFLIGAIILIVLGFNLIRNLFKEDEAPRPEQTVKTINLLDAGRSGKPVQFTIRGSIVGDEEHRSIRITVDGSQRKAEVLQGYNDQVIKTQESTNTPQAYEAFVAAINGGGFTSNVNAQGRGDEAQSCPLGRRLNYEVAPGTEDSFRIWSTSCGRNQGTFTGNSNLIQTLFQRQIPEYNVFVAGIKLSSN